MTYKNIGLLLNNLDWSQYLRQILRDIQNRVYLPQLK